MGVAVITSSVVVASFDRCRAKNAVEISTVWLFVHPLSYGVEHVAMNLKVLVAQSWVMENAEDVIHYFIHRYTRILPCVDDTTIMKLAELGLPKRMGLTG